MYQSWSDRVLNAAAYLTALALLPFIVALSPSARREILWELQGKTGWER